MPKNTSIPDRWWEKVDQRGTDECWPWKASTDRDGYGRFQLPSRIGQYHTRAHRFGYEMLVGAIPVGFVVCHHCDNPPCCNPAHLFLGTNLDNVTDRSAKGRGAPIWGMPLINKTKTHCMRGHEFTPENTYLYRNGTSRRCKQCAPINARLWYWRTKGIAHPDGGDEWGEVAS